MAQELFCPKDGRPMDLKWVSKWDKKLWLHFCHCGYVHELTPIEHSGDSSSTAKDKP